MKRTIPGLSKTTGREEELPGGEYLVEVVRAHYRWQKQKPFYSLSFRVLQPETTRRSTDNRSSVLHRKSVVETLLVLNRLWLRHRFARPR